jgi:O-antigen/teichoic acid export membrane protein
LIYDHVFAPYISQNNQSLNQQQINQFIVKKIRVVFVGSIFVFLSIVFLGEDILSTFGKKTDNYEKGYEAMIILGLGQLINVAFGPVINILILNQQQKVAIYSVSIALVSNILLNYLWIPTMGINGAALATSVSFIIWKSLLFYFVKTKTNFKSAIWERV